MMISKNNVLLLLVFILGSIAIIVRANFAMDTYLSPDSKQYLNVAQNLLDGNGPYVLKDHAKTYFSTWPLGYPVLIAISSMVVHKSVYCGSKILNIIIMLLMLLLYKRIYKQHAYIYALIFLWASYLDIFSYTWSESPFILGLIWFSYATSTFSKKDLSLLDLINISLSSAFLFLIRYIGGFSVFFIGIMALHNIINKKYKDSVKLMVLMATQTIFISIYLYTNLQKSGYMTGIPRTPSFEGNLELFYSLLLAMFFELNVLMAEYSTLTKLVICFIIQAVVLIFFVGKCNQSYIAKIGSIDIFAKSCLGIGSLYIFCITFLRLMKDFDEFGYRFMAPGTLLIAIFLISYMRAKYNKEGFEIFSNCLIALSLLSYFVNVPMVLITKLL